MRRDAQSNRNRILAAAEEVFGEAGRSGSTEEIAKRAGVGIGTVFRHFPTKQLLVEATIVRHLATATELARGRCGSGDPGQAFRETFHEMAMGAPAKLTLVALLEEGGESVTSTVRVADVAAGLQEAVGMLLARAQQAGQVRADVTVDEVYVLVRALASAPGERAVVGRAVDVVLDGLCVVAPCPTSE